MSPFARAKPGDVDSPSVPSSFLFLLLRMRRGEWFSKNVAVISRNTSITIHESLWLHNDVYREEGM